MSTFINAYASLTRLRKEWPQLPANRLFYDYLRLKLKFKLFLRLIRREPGYDRVLNYKVFCPSYRHFLFMVKEILIGSPYYFKSKRKDPVIVDAGSNIGMSVLFFKLLYPESRIMAFEASPDSFAALQKNISENGLQGVTAIPKALSDKEGHITFYQDSKKPWSGSNSIIAERMQKVDNESKRAIQIPTVKLSDMISGPVDFMKIDIEGAEHLVMQDLAASGKLKMIDQMVMEYHHHVTPTDDRLAGMLHLLESNGFGYMITANGGEVFKPGILQDVIIYAYKKQ